MHRSEFEDAGLFTAVPPTPTAGHHHRLAAEDLTTTPWARWLADPLVRERYHSKIYRPTDPSACHFWLGAISDTGHGSFRAGSLPGRTRRGTVPAHLFGYQLAHGPIPRLVDEAFEPTVCHRCDNHSCQNPAHLRLGTAAENRSEWLARRGDPASPLADIRGPAGRARAIARTIRAAQTAGEDETAIASRVGAVINAGTPFTLW
ncbi:hypothetical protein [Streptomyces sp. NPDC048172]|uniref:hypothetical protein n=1 Tax=Streptomyces sp. NPDC048172 TaxID=3365505 RepID=UPI003723A668